jgi:hypothetical protein
MFAFFFQHILNVLCHCLLDCLVFWRETTIYFIEDGLKGIEEGVIKGLEMWAKKALEHCI